MDDILWSISWSAALTPDLQMIPDRTVFLRAACVPANDILLEGMTASLLPHSSTSLDSLFQKPEPDTVPSSDLFKFARLSGEGTTTDAITTGT